MTSDTLKCLSLNVRGLNTYKKRVTLFDWLKNAELDIILLQETHFVKEQESYYNSRWFGEKYHCFSDSVHSRGVSVLFMQNLNLEVINAHRSQDGRKILINVKYLDKTLTLVNVYAPNSEKCRVEFFKRLKSWVREYALNIDGIINEVSSFDFSTLYTSLPHDLIKEKVLSLVKWCFNRESKTYLCTSDKAGFFSNKTYDSYKCWTCSEFSEAFTFLMEHIYVQFGDMVYQQIVGIPMGTNCAPLIADLFLYCYERDFMSNLQKSKRFDLIDKFNDTSRYLDDIFTIDNPEFAEHIPDIYPRELQLNKANASDKGTSFLDLNIKVVGSNIHTSVYDKRDDFGFPIVNFPWLSGDVPRLPSYGIYISQLVRFARCCTSVFDFHSKNRQITSKLL